MNTSAPKTFRLLIIDDDQGILYYLQKIFEERKIQVHTVKGFDEAGNFLSGSRPDMILSDLNAFGSIDGIEFYIQHVAAAEIPFALHSGSIVPARNAATNPNKKYSLAFEKAMEVEDFQLTVQPVSDEQTKYSFGCFIKPASPDLILKYFQSFVPGLITLEPKKIEQLSGPSDERRKHQRYVFPYLASLRKLGQEKFQFALCEDISLGGACLVAGSDAKDMTEMEIKIPLHHNHQSFILHVFGKRIWIKEMENGNASHVKCGVEFEGLTSEDSDFLGRFLEYHIASQQSQEIDVKIRSESKNKKRDLFISAVKYFKDDPEKSLSLFEELLELDPLHVSAILYKGYLLDRLGDSDSAEQMFKKAQELESGQNS